jgi:hypothetical protein
LATLLIFLLPSYLSVSSTPLSPNIAGIVQQQQPQNDVMQSTHAHAFQRTKSKLAYLKKWIELCIFIIFANRIVDGVLQEECKTEATSFQMLKYYACGIFCPFLPKKEASSPPLPSLFISWAFVVRHLLYSQGCQMDEYNYLECNLNRALLYAYRTSIVAKNNHLTAQ